MQISDQYFTRLTYVKNLLIVDLKSSWASCILSANLRQCWLYFNLVGVEIFQREHIESEKDKAPEITNI